jgi:hypothetical protein
VLRDPGDVPEVAAEHRVTIAFPRDAQGDPTSPFGRLPMVVDGKTIDMLFDTGATVDLTASGIAALGGTAQLRATSFITQTVFDGWRAAHPEWRVWRPPTARRGDHTALHALLNRIRRQCASKCATSDAAGPKSTSLCCR